MSRRGRLGCSGIALLGAIAMYQIASPDSITSKAYSLFRSDPVPARGASETLRPKFLSSLADIVVDAKGHAPYTGLAVEYKGFTLKFEDYRPSKTEMGEYNRQGYAPTKSVVPGYARVGVYREGAYLGSAEFCTLNSLVFPSSDFTFSKTLRKVGIPKAEVSAITGR